MTNALPVNQPLASPGDLAQEAPQLESASLDALRDWARQAATTAQAPEWRRQGQRWLEAKQAGAVAHAAYALLLDRLGEREESQKQLLVLCDRLSQAGGWEGIRWVAGYLLERTPVAAAARWLVRAAEETGDAEAIFVALTEAHERAPGDAQLGWRLAQELEARGDHEEALHVTGEALEAMIHRKDLAALDEILLFLLEAPRAETLRLAFPAFPVLARSGQVGRLAEYLDLAAVPIRELGLAKDAWRAVRDAVLAADDPKPIFRLLPSLVEQAYPQGTEAVRLLEFSGLLDGTSAREALPVFDRLLPYAPGSFLEHSTWGAGKVARLDREEIWIDFLNRPHHRMTLRAAQQALTSVDAEDLVVLASLAPDELVRLRLEDPVELVRRALLRLKGEAELPALKRVLVHYAVPEKEWTKFWKAAKSKMESDPRIDSSQAYRKLYRLAPEGESAQAAEAPRFDRGANATKALAVLHRYLEQHPDQVASLLERNATTLERWRDDPDLPWRQRFDAAALLTQSDDPNAVRDAERVVADAFRSGFDLRELPAAADQERVLRWGLATAAWAAAARSAFGSRSAEIREAGLVIALERHGESAREFLETTVLDSRSAPEAALQVATWAFGSKGRPAGFPEISVWDAVIGLAELLESGPTSVQAKAAVALLTLDGDLLAAARRSVPHEDRLRRLRRLATHWRSSDRHLHPLLEWLDAAGHSEIVAEANSLKRQAARAVTATSERASPYDISQIYCTRGTFAQLRREAESVQQALKTTIPAAIQKARELGDLRENAEYESARLKQRQAQARLELLAKRMDNTLFIEDVEPEPGRVGLGTEVILEGADGAELRYWLLGEGDTAVGSNVVSYMAPIGRALFDHEIGDTIEVPGEDGPTQATIRAVERRLPTQPADASVES